MKISEFQKTIFDALNLIFDQYNQEINIHINLPQTPIFPLIKISSIAKIPSLILNQEKFELNMQILNNTKDNSIITEIVEFLQFELKELLNQNEKFISIDEDIVKIHDNFNDKIWTGEYSLIMTLRL